MPEINFIQKNTLYYSKDSLFEDLIAHILETKRLKPFGVISIIVANKFMALWLTERITERLSICTNIEFVTLPGSLIDKIYQDNNPAQQLFKFDDAELILYDIIIDVLNQRDTAKELLGETIYSYLLDSNLREINREHAFNLASQLKQVFQEYTFVRPQEMLTGEIWKAAQQHSWQRIIWQRLNDLIHHQLQQVTFVDIYNYLQNTIPKKIPDQINIFALSSIFPAQLKIICDLSKYTTINWFHFSVSNRDYLPLLAASSKLELSSKEIRDYNFTIDDLQVIDGNRLFAGLAQHFLEFDVLLKQAQVKSRSPSANSSTQALSYSILQLIQQDVRTLTMRSSAELKLNQVPEYNSSQLAMHDGYDNSIVINVCHNQMREVQVMFNQLAEILNNNADIHFNDILVTAPDIDIYAPLIKAVFDEEYLIAGNGKKLYLPYNITGNRYLPQLMWFKSLELLLNMPFHMPVSYLLDLFCDGKLMQVFEISTADIELFRKWLYDNNTHFGYDKVDYAQLNYPDYDLFSLRRLINNLILGLAIPESVASQVNTIPLFVVQLNKEPHLLNDASALYDNLELSHVTLLNKFITLIDLLHQIRDLCYVDATTYRLFTVAQLNQILVRFFEVGVFDDSDKAACDKLLKKLAKGQYVQINLPVVNQIIDTLRNESSDFIKLNGSLTIASLRQVRDVPFKVIYVMGLNFGEFPRANRFSSLSILATERKLGDRDMINEDKQLFLALIMAAQQQFIISYVGKSATRNEEILPSSVVSLLTDVIENSISIQDSVVDRLYRQHALHPFLATDSGYESYSGYWQLIKSSAVNFVCDSRFKANFDSLPITTKERLLQCSVTDLINTLRYTNYNLYRLLGLDNYKYIQDLNDTPSYNLQDKTLAKALWREFSALGMQKLDLLSFDEVLTYMQIKGIIAYGAIGEYQLRWYFQLFKFYCLYTGGELFYVHYEDEAGLKVYQEFRLLDQTLYLLPKFYNVKPEEPLDKRLQDFDLSMQFIVWSWLLASSNSVITDKLGERIEFHPKIQVVTFYTSNDNEALITHDFPCYQIANQEELNQQIPKYYFNSLSQRTLVHKNAICNYQKGNLGKLYAALYATSLNYQLEELRNSELWSGDINDYPQLAETAKNNMLLNLAEIYLQVSVS